MFCTSVEIIGFCAFEKSGSGLSEGLLHYPKYSPNFLKYNCFFKYNPSGLTPDSS